MEAPKDKLMKQKRVLKHNWRRLSELLQNEAANYFVCKRCGMVQNKDNKDNPCRGKVKMRAPEKPKA